MTGANVFQLKYLIQPSSLRRAQRTAQVLIPIMTFSSFHDPNHLYFVTASICGWKHLFADQKYAQIVLDSLSWLQKARKILLFAFVIMPSHLHLILKPENKTIDEILQDFGSFTAHTILHQLRKDKRDDLLKLFHEQRRDTRHQHSIWQDIQAKNIYSHEFLSEKNGDTPIIPITDVNEWLML